jgi:hypothetical protein
VVGCLPKNYGHGSFRLRVRGHRARRRAVPKLSPDPQTHRSRRRWGAWAAPRRHGQHSGSQSCQPGVPGVHRTSKWRSSQLLLSCCIPGTRHRAGLQDCAVEAKRYRPGTTSDFPTCGYGRLDQASRGYEPVAARPGRTAPACGRRYRELRPARHCPWAAARRSR